MLQRDYIVEMTRRFGEVLSKRLRAAMLDADPDAIHDLEDAVGNLLDLDGATALSLDPDSLVTMMEAICKSFMVEYGHVPEEYCELDAEIAAEKERA